MEAALQLEVSAAAGGDRSAYGRLVNRHQNLVSSIALAIVGDVATSEDVAQDVFIHAWSSLSTLRNPHSFLPWLRQLTRNRAHKQLEAGGRRPWTLAREESLLAEAADARPSAESALASEEQRRALARALEELPDEQREVLVLYYREDKSAHQVAELLGLSDDAVKKRLSRARAQLREDILSRFEETAAETRPGETFSAAVLAGLPTAGTAAVPAMAAKLGKGALLKAAMVVGGGLAGPTSGLGAIAFATWKAARNIRSASARRELILSGVVQALLCIGWIALYSWLDRLQSPWPGFISFLVFAAALNAVVFGWTRRIALADARRETDLSASPGYRRGMRFGIAGAVLGTTCGLAGALSHLLTRLH